MIDNLTIAASGAILNSNSVWGALRGIETFSQLVLQQSTDMVRWENALLNPAFLTNTLFCICPQYSIQFNSIQFIDQLRALKGQQENCT